MGDVEMNEAKRMMGGVLRGTRSTLLGILVAAVVALGVPLFWVWVASKIAGTERDVTPSLALFITASILVSYWLVLLVGGWVRRRWVGEQEELSRRKRMSWNRSFREESYRPGEQQSDPVELVFVITAVLGVILFEIWFFFFAGSPLPNQPLF